MDKNIVTLTPGEVMLARTLAAFRTGMNRVTKVKQPVKFGNRDDFENDLVGICGEIAFAKRMNIYLDLSFNPRSGGSDFRLRDGSSADVKTTERDDGQLIVPVWKEKKPSDFYVLVTGKIPTSREPAQFHIRGYATKKEIFASKGSVGHGPCFLLKQKDLHPFR